MHSLMEETRNIKKIFIEIIIKEQKLIYLNLDIYQVILILKIM